MRILETMCVVAGVSFLFAACGGDTSTDAGVDGSAQDATTQDAPQDVSAQDVTANDVTTQDANAQDGGDAATDGGGASDAAADGGLAALCTGTGGTVTTALCCKNTPDFPNTCTVGPCGCSPNNSHNVQSCQCPANKCFTPQLGCH